MMRSSLVKTFVLLIALSAVASTAAAVELTLDQGRLYSADYANGAVGSGRGLGFLADENFSMSTFAMDLSVPAAETAPEYIFEIFSSPDGRTAGALLASTTFFLAEAEGYQPQPFNFDFVAGNFYVMNFSRVDNSGLGQMGCKYSWEDTGAFVPYDYGVLTLLEGFEGSSPDPSNPLIPHVQFDGAFQVQETTPVPALNTIGLIALLSLIMITVVMTYRNRYGHRNS